MKKNSSDIPIEIFYSKEQSKPGEYPFKHGIYPKMYRHKLWTMRQYSGFSTAKESNKRYHYLLKQILLTLVQHQHLRAILFLA